MDYASSVQLILNVLGLDVSELRSYIIDHRGFDWPDLLSSWAWLLPREFTVWIMNRFGDLVLVFEDDSVHLLDVGRGALERLAGDRDEFAKRVDEDDNGSDWFMIPLVDELVASGQLLRDGQCYSYKQLPLLGGDYTPENTRIVTIGHHYKAFGPIHERLKDIPDGTSVKFSVDKNQIERTWPFFSWKNGFALKRRRLRVTNCQRQTFGHAAHLDCSADTLV